MEQEKSFKFKLFVPPKPNNTQVSAVKPQTSRRDGRSFQNLNNRTEEDYHLPFGKRTTSELMDLTDPDSLKAKHVPEIDRENVETTNELYSRLYKEAEKIKRWKVTVEYELKEKERILQENRRITEVLRKAIQELQFENEKLSLKLEDEINENKDLLKENNATRHLCNLLKEKFMQSMEKVSKYEHEREETRQLYVDLNNNIERMIQAFEELRVQAENSRLEMYFKLKEEAEKIAALEKECGREINVLEKQVSTLTIQIGEKDNQMKHINKELQTSKELITELEEIKRKQDNIITKAQSKEQDLLTELEETKCFLQKTENTCKILETELQTAVKTLIQVTEQKEVAVEELKEAKVLHASVISELQSEVSSLKDLTEIKEKRLEELRNESDTLVLELQKKSDELEVMAKGKNDKEKQVEEMARALESCTNIEKDLKHQLDCAQSECMLLIKEKETRISDEHTTQVQVQELLDGKYILEKTIEKLQQREKELKDTLQIKEEEMHHLEMQLSEAFENKEICLQKFTAMTAELEKAKLKNEQLSLDWNKLLLDKEQIIQEKSNIVNEFRKLQEDLKDKSKRRQEAENQIENLKETNMHLRDELECLKEKMMNKDEETKYKLDESKANVRNTENEILKKEKLMKTLENKINVLKKKIETKSKIVEDLQQENKVLRKKVATEGKQMSITEEKVNKLQLELENMNKLHTETVDSYKNETEMARAAEENLLKELKAMKLATDEAVKMQKEIDVRCQHKITEMVTLMEKHKRQYDKTVEEKDTELECYRTKQQVLSSTIESLEKELSSQKNEISTLQERLKTVQAEKESLIKQAEKGDLSKSEKKHKKTQAFFLETPKLSSLVPLSVTCKRNTPHNFTANINKLEQTEKSSWTPAKTYTVKTPPKSKFLRESTNLLSEEGRKKKRKVLLDMDSHSDNSDKIDLLSIVSEEERFKQLYEDNPQTSHLNFMTPKRIQTPSSLKTPGSSVNHSAIRKLREAGWAAVSKMDRRKKMKEAGKLFS